MPTTPENWTEADGSLTRDLELADFAAALACVNRVGEVAEAANHHPDVLIHDYKHVRLTLTTHSTGGLTDADFELARALNAVLPSTASP